MTDYSLRTAIARAISPDWWSDGIAVENREVKQEISLQQADAVLKVLADLPESVIERATEALRQDSYRVACPPWNSLSEEHKAGWLARGRHVLRAAFGINNYKEKSK